jgi:hypothetical protein
VYWRPTSVKMSDVSLSQLKAYQAKPAVKFAGEAEEPKADALKAKASKLKFGSEAEMPKEEGQPGFRLNAKA